MSREVALQSRSTIPIGMRSICPEPNIVAIKKMQNSGNTTHAPK